AVLFPLPPSGASDGPAEKDWKGKFAEAGVKPFTPKKDPKTGFVVGGTNATALIRKLTEINGRTVAAPGKGMRPEKLSRGGFLGKDEKLLEVMAADNEYVVEQLGLTHQELAMHLHLMGAIGERLGAQRGKPKTFLYHGRKFSVEILAWK